VTAYSTRFSAFLSELRQFFSGWSPVTWRGLSGVLRNPETEFGEVRLSGGYPSRHRPVSEPPGRGDGITRGVPLDQVMELLGHSSYQMVLRYTKARPSQLTEAIETLNPIQEDTKVIDADINENTLMNLMKNTGHALPDHEISERFSCGEPTVFYTATQLLSKGEPICFSSCSGWKDSAGSEDVHFWHTKDLKDLETMAIIIQREVEMFQGMLAGVEIARQRLTTNDSDAAEGVA
jgi:hypothetical protein